MIWAYIQKLNVIKVCQVFQRNGSINFEVFSASIEDKGQFWRESLIKKFSNLPNIKLINEKLLSANLQKCWPLYLMNNFSWTFLIMHNVSLL